MIPIQNIYYLLCYAWNTLDEKERVSVEVEDNTELVDLFAKVLINSSTILLKRGFEKNYKTYRNERTSIKGKLEVSESLKNNSFQHLKAVCTYDEYSADILHNQILITTLYRLLNTTNLDSGLKDRIRRLLWMFPPVRQIELHLAVFQQVRIHRNNRFYGFLLNICQLLYQSSLPTEDKGTLFFTDFTRDDYKMATLFEKFIFRFYSIEMPFLKPSVKLIKWNLQPLNDEYKDYLPLMKTDITLRGADPKIIIDAKYYRETLRENFGKEKIKSENLYQLFSYLINQEDGSEASNQTIGILLYPTIDDEYDLQYRFQDHDVHIKTVNLNTHWSNIERRLKEIVN